jgi:hypothetical protein
VLAGVVTTRALGPEEVPGRLARFRRYTRASLAGWARGEVTPLICGRSMQRWAYSGAGGHLEAARQAEVIFAGTSRMAQGLHRDPVAAWGRRSFNLGTGPTEGYRFTRDVILQYDLRPRILVANVDRYFVHPYSVATGQVLREDWFTRRKALLSGHEVALWRTLQYHLPASVARFDISPSRWRSDGTQFLPGLLERQGPSAPGQPVALEGPEVLPSIGRQEQVQGFRDLLAARGTRLVLTHVPSSDPTSPGWARRAVELGRRFDLPVVLPPREGLETWDASHLTAASARRFTRDLLRELEPLLAAPAARPGRSP